MNNNPSENACVAFKESRKVGLPIENLTANF